MCADFCFHLLSVENFFWPIFVNLLFVIFVICCYMVEIYHNHVIQPSFVISMTQYCFYFANFVRLHSPVLLHYMTQFYHMALFCCYTVQVCSYMALFCCVVQSTTFGAMSSGDQKKNHYIYKFTMAVGWKIKRKKHPFSSCRHIVVTRPTLKPINNSIGWWYQMISAPCFKAFFLLLPIRIYNWESMRASA